jgi:hypothetical protein
VANIVQGSASRLSLFPLIDDSLTQSGKRLLPFQTYWEEQIPIRVIACLGAMLGLQISCTTLAWYCHFFRSRQF